MHQAVARSSEKIVCALHPVPVLQPENIVIEGGAWGGKVYLVDFGGVQVSIHELDTG